MLYADSSALVKLVLAETESDALDAYLGDRPLASSAFARTELVRAVRRLRPDREEAAIALLASLDFIDINREVLTRAATLPPPQLRSLDAIHLASALALGEELEALLTYDARMAEAARAAGLHVESPA